MMHISDNRGIMGMSRVSGRLLFTLKAPSFTASVCPRQVGEQRGRWVFGMDMTSGIYEIRNTINGHRYIGSTANLKRRWRKHRSDLNKGRHHSVYLQRAWNKYGDAAFVFEILEKWNIEFLVSMEQWWMNMLSPEYNIAPVARSCLGVKHTEETKANKSAFMIRRFRDPEERAKIGLTSKGRKHTPESKAKIGAAHRGRIHSSEWRANNAASKMGHEVSPETREKISASNKGKKHTPEWCAWHSERMRGNTYTKGKPWSPARRAAQKAKE